MICHTDLIGSAIKLKPLVLTPTRATLLNTGKPVAFSLEMAPSDHVEHQGFLRLTHLPTKALADTVAVIKLEFDHPLPELVTPQKSKPSDVLIR